MSNEIPREYQEMVDIVTQGVFDVIINWFKNSEWVDNEFITIFEDENFEIEFAGIKIIKDVLAFRLNSGSYLSIKVISDFNFISEFVGFTINLVGDVNKFSKVKNQSSFSIHYNMSDDNGKELYTKIIQKFSDFFSVLCLPTIQTLVLHNQNNFKNLNGSIL